MYRMDLLKRTVTGTDKGTTVKASLNLNGVVDSHALYTCFVFIHFIIQNEFVIKSAMRVVSHSQKCTITISQVWFYKLLSLHHTELQREEIAQ